MKEKVGTIQKTNYFPPNIDRLHDNLNKLYSDLKIDKRKDEKTINIQAMYFFEALKRMSDEERLVLMTILLYGCIMELPKNTHIAIDLVRRHTEFPPAKIKRIIGNLRSLGIFVKIREKEKSETDGHLGNTPQIELEYIVLIVGPHGGNATDIARTMIKTAVSGLCQQHGMESLSNLNFSQLSSVTFEKHSH